MQILLQIAMSTALMGVVSRQLNSAQQCLPAETNECHTDADQVHVLQIKVNVH
jgi:hypothetical protein